MAEKATFGTAAIIGTPPAVTIAETVAVELGTVIDPVVWAWLNAHATLGFTLPVHILFLSFTLSFELQQLFPLLTLILGPDPGTSAIASPTAGASTGSATPSSSAKAPESPAPAPVAPPAGVPPAVGSSGSTPTLKDLQGSQAITSALKVGDICPVDGQPITEVFTEQSATGPVPAVRTANGTYYGQVGS